MKKLSFLLLLIGFFKTATAQEIPAIELEEEEPQQELVLSGYLDTYFAIFTNEMEPNALQPFTTVSPRSDRFGLNVAQIGAAYTGNRVRSALTLHYGDIAQATWSEEFRAVQEANVGIRLGGDWWVDAGFFRTHIGTESFLPKNNLLSSTAVATYNEPFYQSGAKLSYEGSDILTAELHVVSGYNFFLDVNDAKSVGVLLSLAPSDDFSVTYTNLLGWESPDDAPIDQFRTYHNLYINWKLVDKLLFIIGGDLGTQTNSQLENGSETAVMYNALATVRWQATPSFALTARGEVFDDPEGFISGTFLDTKGNEQGLSLTGFTLGAEYRPIENAYVRLEGRRLETPEDLLLFINESPTNVRYEFMITTGIILEKVLNW